METQNLSTNALVAVSRRASAAAVTAHNLLNDGVLSMEYISPGSAAASAAAGTGAGGGGGGGSGSVWVHGDHPSTPDDGNGTGWAGGDDGGRPETDVPHVLKAMVLILIILLAIFSNLLVVISVFRYHKLRHINNYFLVSLAVADLLVACFAMTFNATVEITGKWNFGYRICDLWNSLDVHFSTVSTLHLCCISADRYYAIVKPLKYTSHMTVRVASVMIGVAWTAPTLISFLPIFLGWYTTQDHQEWRLTHEDECIFRVNQPYALLSSTLTFWAPVIVMLFLYHSIYKEAVRQKEAIRRSSVPSQQHMIVDSSQVRSHFAVLQANGFKSTARKGIARLLTGPSPPTLQPPAGPSLPPPPPPTPLLMPQSASNLSIMCPPPNISINDIPTTTPLLSKSRPPDLRGGFAAPNNVRVGGGGGRGSAGSGGSGGTDTAGATECETMFGSDTVTLASPNASIARGAAGISSLTPQAAMNPNGRRRVSMANSTTSEAVSPAKTLRMSGDGEGSPSP